MSSPPAPPDDGDSASQPIFTDEILGEIFLRLDAAADLARASAACTAFLRVVRFLRRNRSLYRQPIVGFLEYEVHPPLQLQPRSFYHAQSPHHSASAARELAEAADFTCSFLPDPGSWRLNDATGGRLLLCSDSSDDAADYEFDDLVVCDPLNRRYVRIPRIPVDLTDAFTSGAHYHFPNFLAPTGQEEGSSFQVIWMMYDLEEMKVTAFVFFSVTDQWRLVTFDGWESVGGIEVMLTSCRHHPHISLYNSYRWFSEALMLDTHKMEFSVIRTPLVRHYDQHAIVEAGEGRLGFLTIGDGMLDLYCKAWQDNGVSTEEWQHKKTVPIPLADSNRYSISFCGTDDGYLLIQAIPPDSAELQQKPEIHYFTLHVKTLLVERLCLLNKRVDVAYLYTNFLPPLSLPTV